MSTRQERRNKPANINKEISEINSDIINQRQVKNNLLNEINQKTTEFNNINDKYNKTLVEYNNLEKKITEYKLITENLENLKKQYINLSNDLQNKQSHLNKINKEITEEINLKYEKIENETKDKYNKSLDLLKLDFNNDKIKLNNELVNYKENINVKISELDLIYKKEKEKIYDKLQYKELEIKELNKLKKINKYQEKNIQTDNILFKENYNLEISKPTIINYSAEKKTYHDFLIQTDDINFQENNKQIQHTPRALTLSDISMNQSVLEVNRLLNKKPVYVSDINDDNFIFKKNKKLIINKKINEILMFCKLTKNLNMYLFNEKNIKIYLLNIRIVRINGKQTNNYIRITDCINNKKIYEEKSNILLNDTFEILFDLKNKKLNIYCNTNNETHTYNLKKQIKLLYTENTDLKINIK